MTPKAIRFARMAGSYAPGDGAVFDDLAKANVDQSSIDSASAAVDALAAKLRGIGALTAAAATPVASAAGGGGAPQAGTFRAAANRQFAGASQTG